MHAEITTYRNDDGNGPDERPDEMVINPQPAPMEMGKKGEERDSGVITSSQCHLKVARL